MQMKGFLHKEGIITTNLKVPVEIYEVCKKKKTKRKQKAKVSWI